MNEFMKHAWLSWQETRNETIIFIDSLSNSDLTRKMPRPGLDTFGVHFQELGVIQGSFTNALKHCKMNYSLMVFEPIPNLITNSNKLKEFLNTKNNEFQTVLEAIKDPNQIIEWGLPRSPTALEHVYWLMQHETLHHGQFLAFSYMMNIKIPEALVQHWNMPSLAPDVIDQWIRDQGYLK